MQISNLMKIRLVREELFHVERRTGMTKLTVVFHNFTKAPKTTTTSSDQEKPKTLNIIKFKFRASRD